MPTPPIVTPVYAAPEPQSARNLRGAALMAFGFFSFAACDAMAKLLTDHFNPFQVVWFRQLGLLIGVLLILALRGRQVLSSARPGLQILRGVVAVASASCFIFAIQHVPLADAVAVSFVAPFMVTVMGALFLRERVGARRWAAVSVGFLGAMIVIRPGFGVFHPAIFLVVIAAAAFAVRQVLSRWLAGSDRVVTTVAYTSLTSSAITTMILPFVWITPPNMTVIALIVGMTATSAIGEVMVIRALDLAEAVVVAPIHYSLILWGTMYGFLIFGDLPDYWTLIGCTVIMASGLYTLHRERLAARRAQKMTAPE